MEHVEFERAFSDKASGKDAKRPQLEALMTFLRAGNRVVARETIRDAGLKSGSVVTVERVKGRTL